MSFRSDCRTGEDATTTDVFTEVGQKRDNYVFPSAPVSDEGPEIDYDAMSPGQRAAAMLSVVSSGKTKSPQTSQTDVFVPRGLHAK